MQPGVTRPTPSGNPPQTSQPLHPSPRGQRTHPPRTLRRPCTATLHGYGFFADVIFHAQEDPGKRYLVGFWVKPGADKLEIGDTRIRKAPRREGTAWTLQTRQPIPWWWIPASEHPGKTEQTRGWEVMSAVEESVVQRRDPKNGTMKLKDPVTGEALELDFVGTHQPDRKSVG